MPREMLSGTNGEMAYARAFSAGCEARLAGQRMSWIFFAGRSRYHDSASDKPALAGPAPLLKRAAAAKQSVLTQAFLAARGQFSRKQRNHVPRPCSPAVTRWTSALSVCSRPIAAVLRCRARAARRSTFSAVSSRSISSNRLRMASGLSELTRLIASIFGS
jgi:hypothetical protein